MKTMFVWEYVEGGLTDNYHSGGGCVVIADDKDKALQLLADYGVGSSCEVFKTDPDYSASVDAVEDKVFIFPDAGCC